MGLLSRSARGARPRSAPRIGCHQSAWSRYQRTVSSSACSKLRGRPPAEFGLGLARVDGVAPVVAGTVGHEGDQPLVRAGLRPQPVDDRAQGPDPSRLLRTERARREGRSRRSALLQHRDEAAGVILDVDPVALVLAVAVDGEVLALQRVERSSRDQLLGEVPRPVIVRAVGHQHRQAVGLVPGAGQVVAPPFEAE